MTVTVGNGRKVVYSRTPTVVTTSLALRDIIHSLFPRFRDSYPLNYTVIRLKISAFTETKIDSVNSSESHVEPLFVMNYK